MLLACGLAYSILVRALVSHHGPESALVKALRIDRKGNLSLALYVSAIPLAYVQPWISAALYVTVALMWLVPDKRIERKISR